MQQQLSFFSSSLLLLNGRLRKGRMHVSIQSGKGQFLWLCHWHKTMRVLRKKWHGNVETKNTTTDTTS